MPVLLSECVVDLEFSDLLRRHPISRPASPLSRAPGAHVSDILGYIGVKVGWLTAQDLLTERMPWRMAMGVMWEEFYFSMLTGSDWQPGERTVDGVSGNADGLTALDEPLVCTYNGSVLSMLEETKCTEKKVRDGQDFMGESMWMHQGREYCYLYDQRVVRYTPMFYRGDWAGSGPVCKQYVVEFSEQEIRQTHRMVMKYKAEMEGKGLLSTVW